MDIVLKDIESEFHANPIRPVTYLDFLSFVSGLGTSENPYKNSMTRHAFKLLTGSMKDMFKWGSVWNSRKNDFHMIQEGTCELRLPKKKTTRTCVLRLTLIGQGMEYAVNDYLLHNPNEL
jgi:hypothetical protein